MKASVRSSVARIASGAFRYFNCLIIIWNGVIKAAAPAGQVFWLYSKVIVWKRIFKAASTKRVINCLKALTSLVLSAITRKSFVWGVPFIVTIEPTVCCNLHCPQCAAGMGQVKREQVYLSLNLYKNVMEQIGDKIWYLLLYNQGEPFLNPDLLQFIHCAKQKGIYVTTSTNGHFLSDINFVTQLVKSGLDTIIVSLDGADPQTFLKYRVGGDFCKVIAGIKNLIEAKKKFNSKTPEVLVQSLVMKHNEHQLAQIKKLARELNVDRLLFKTFQVESQEQGQHFLPGNPKWRRYQLKDGPLTMKNFPENGCLRLWYSTVILSDGRIVPCCFDKNGKYTPGNIGTTVLVKKIWESDAYNKFRNKILRRKETIDICQNCTQNQRVYV